MKALWMRSLCAALCLMGLALSDTPRCSAQTFTSTGNMITARYYHTATLLQNGLVLIAGGVGSSGYLATAELYNPTTGMFTVTGSLHTARERHTATLLKNGMVLFTGGYDGNHLASAELYNPVTGAFTVTGSMSNQRDLHTATLLQNGLVLVAGGYVGHYVAPAELFNPATGTFAVTGTLQTPRDIHTAALLNNGKVLIAGGNNGNYLANAEIYDPSTGAFSVTGSLHTARYYHAAALLGNGMALITGGQSSGGTVLTSAELYNSASGVFTVTGVMGTKRELQTETLLPNGTMLLAGGRSPSYLSSAELYSLSTDAFAATGSMSQAREIHTATLLNNGTVLIAGGQNSSGNPISISEIYHSVAPIAGFMTPKYVVLSVIYAPPGEQSFVSYGSSTLVGSSSSLDSSVSSSSTISVSGSVGISGSLHNLPVGGTIMTTDTSSRTWTEVEDTSSSIAVQKSASINYTVPGPLSSEDGIDHNYDQIVVWLNPEVDITVTSPTSGAYNYSFDPRDPANEVDPIYLYVKDLKSLQAGTFTGDPNIPQRLARTWSPLLADGSAPGLTSVDYASILARDPFANGSTTINLTRFDLQFGETFPYEPPPCGGQPATTQAMETYDVTSTQGLTATDIYQVGVSKSFDASFLSWFATNFTSTTSTTWTNMVMQQYTAGSGQTANVSITGPNSCTYTGPTDLQIYKDNIYGTFLIAYVNQ